METLIENLNVVLYTALLLAGVYVLAGGLGSTNHHFPIPKNRKVAISGLVAIVLGISLLFINGTFDQGDKHSIASNGTGVEEPVLAPISTQSTNSSTSSKIKSESSNSTDMDKPTGALPVVVSEEKNTKTENLPVQNNNESPTKEAINPKVVSGSIFTPVSGEKVEKSFVVSGVVNNIPKDQHLWLANEANGYFWVYGSELGINEGKWSKAITEHDNVSGEEFTIILMSFDNDANNEVMSYIDKADWSVGLDINEVPNQMLDVVSVIMR